MFGIASISKRVGWVSIRVKASLPVSACCLRVLSSPPRKLLIGFRRAERVKLMPTRNAARRAVICARARMGKANIAEGEGLEASQRDRVMMNPIR